VKKGSSSKNNRHDDDFDMEWDESDKNKTPLELLAKAASFANPKQFELTKDITCNIQLPGGFFIHICQVDLTMNIFQDLFTSVDHILIIVLLHFKARASQTV